MEIESVNQILKDNQILASVISMYGLGILTWTFRNIPRSIYNWLHRNVTTSLIITSASGIFHLSMKWFEENYKNNSFRTLKINSKVYDDADNALSIGYGHHWIWYKRNLLYVKLNKEENNQTQFDKDSISVTMLGRSRKLFDSLIGEFKGVESDTAKTGIYVSQNDWWEHMRDQTKRSWDSIFIEKGKYNQIISRLDYYLNSEDWYVDHGIPYQMGILLYGKPGTGKTSMIKAIASYLNYPIYYLPSSNLSYIETVVAKLPNRAILVIEDIDSSVSTHNRGSKHVGGKDVSGGDTDSSVPENSLMGEMVQGWGISDILNSLDGLYAPHGRLLISTTNHIEKLDPALIREGRFDLKIEIGFVNNEILDQFMKSFFPEEHINCEGIKVVDGLTVAKLQDMVMNGYSSVDIIDQILV